MTPAGDELLVGELDLVTGLLQQLERVGVAHRDDLRRIRRGRFGRRRRVARVCGAAGVWAAPVAGHAASARARARPCISSSPSSVTLLPRRSLLWSMVTRSCARRCGWERRCAQRRPTGSPGLVGWRSRWQSGCAALRRSAPATPISLAQPVNRGATAAASAALEHDPQRARLRPAGAREVRHREHAMRAATQRVRYGPPARTGYRGSAGSSS